MKKFLLLFIALFLVQGCSKPQQELKSPCVGAKGSPCDERTPINDHWMNS